VEESHGGDDDDVRIRIRNRDDEFDEPLVVEEAVCYIDCRMRLRL
jgi:hypothetical protein